MKSTILGAIIFFALTQPLSAQGYVEKCLAKAGDAYFVDSVILKTALGKRAMLYVGYPKEVRDTMLSVLLLSSADACIVMPNVITCEECVGRGTAGVTYKGAIVKGTTVILKQYTFDYYIDIHISLVQRVPSYSKIVIETINKTAGKRTIRTCLPKRTLYLTQLRFMDLDLDDKTLQRYFTIIKRRI